MHVFQFQRRLMGDFESCTRSLAKLQAADVQACQQGRFDPDAFARASLVQLKPSFDGGRIVEHLVDEQLLTKESASILCGDRSSYREALNECRIKANTYQIRPSRLAA